jgi:hypothetical protein
MSKAKEITTENKFDKLSDTMSIDIKDDDDLLDEMLENEDEGNVSPGKGEEIKEDNAKEEIQAVSWTATANGNGKKQKLAMSREKFADFSEIQLCKVLGEIKIKSYKASRLSQTRVLKYLKNDLYELAFIVCALSNELNQMTNGKTEWPAKFRQALESDKWFNEFKNYFNKKNPKYLCRSELLVREFLSK